MINTNTAPDMSNFFLTQLQKFASEMQMAYELEKACVGNEHPIALGVKQGLSNGLPLDIILSNLRSMATVNKNAIADIIGLELTEKILKS